MHEGDQAELEGQFGGAVLTAVINQDDLIDKFVGQIAVGSFERLGRVVGGHDDYDFLAVQHKVKLRPRISCWMGNHSQIIIPREMGGGKNVRVANRAKGQYPEPTMLFLRDELCRSLTGRGLAPGSHAGFKLLDNVLGDNFIDAWYLVGAPVLICCFRHQLHSLCP